MRSKQGAQEAYEGENPYGPNVSQFERDVPKYEDEVKQIKSIQQQQQVVRKGKSQN